jgi:hypothetical protein
MLRLLPDRHQQSALADPGGSLDQHGPARAGRDLVEHRARRIQLLVAFDQLIGPCHQLRI